MTVSDTSASHSMSRDVLFALRYHLGGRTGLIAIAAIGLGTGAYFNWGWLVAAGIAPLILGVAPCAAMCALGLCMSGMKHKQVSPPNSSLNQASQDKLAPKANDTHGKGCC